MSGRTAAAGCLLLVAAAAVHSIPQPPAGAPAPPLALEVTLAPARPTVGDRIEAVLTLRAPAAWLAGTPRFPVFEKGWGEAEILVRGEPERAGEARGIVTYSQRLVLAAFRPGHVALPPVTAAVPGKQRTVTASTPAGLALEVRSVLPAGGKDLQPRPAAPMRLPAIGQAFWWSLATLAALALAAGWLLWRRRARAASAAAATAPPAAPLPELLAEIGALAALEPFDSPGSSLAVHTRLSLALRRYLGRSLDLPARESTTTEIHRLLQGRGVPHLLLRRTIELLRACDLVKFARQEVGPERCRERLAAARALAEELEAALHPPATVSGEGPEDRSAAPARRRLEAAG